MKYTSLVLIIASALLLCNCSTPKGITYFQDADSFNQIAVPTANEITVKKSDKLTIVVNSKDPVLAAMFNLPVTGYRVGATQTASSLSNSNQQISCYTVDSNGEIDFPVLGKIKVEGSNREQISTFIKTRLISEELINDPVVTVEFANLYFSVLGEVARPGRFDIHHDRVTLLDAISMAGDLTINGQRNNVIVWREEGDHLKSFRVDLTSGENLYTSPVFYLQQKDIVYVEPNAARKRQSTVNGNNVRSTSFWLSLTSLLTSIAILITNNIK